MTSTKNSLHVFYNSNPVGKIYLDHEDQFCFEYSKDWLAASNSFPLSHSLPLKNISYLDDAQIFFANLLPEGKVRPDSVQETGNEHRRKF